MIKGIPILLLLLINCISAFFFKEAFKKPTIWEILTSDKRFTQLVHEIESNNLTDVYKKLNAQTVFAASDVAFSTNSIVKRKVSSEQLLYHVATVSTQSDELWDGRILDTHATLDDLPQRLKVLKSGSDLSISTGVQQVKISESDIRATNGVVHVIDQLLSLPDYLDETLYRAENTGEFYHASKKADLLYDFKHAKGNTVFVAKGDVFGNEFESFEKKYLLEHPDGQKDLRRFIQHQVATKIFFSDEFEEGDSTIKTVEGSEDLHIHVKNKKGAPSEITVNGIPIIQSDIMAANGVVHVLEKPLMPKHKQDFFKLTPRKALIGLNATRFVELIDHLKLTDYLDENKELTLLAPPNDSMDFFADSKKLESWLKYHIIRGRVEPDQLKDNALLETESHNHLGDDQYQRIDVHITESSKGKSIQFGRSGILGDPVSVGKHFIIYPIQRALELPRSPLHQISIDLDLSTYLAGLYSSGSDGALDDARGISVFAPTNDAFTRLGLLAKYLLHPNSKQDLEQVVMYHAVRGVFYDQFIKDGEHKQITLEGDDIELNKTRDGLFVRGHGANDGNDRLVLGRVTKSDILTSNGVLHTIDRVQLPPSLQVDNRNLLSVEGTHNLLQLIQNTDIADKVLADLDPKQPYTILAPSDRAFNRIDNLSDLLQDKKRLEEMVKLHIIPASFPRLDPEEALRGDDVPFTGEDYPTLLDAVTVQIYKSVSGGYGVRIKNSLQEGAEVTSLGRNTAGGGVIMIDRVLLPEHKEDVGHHFAWWTILLMVIGGIVAVVNIFILGFVGWKWYKGHRDGYIRLSSDN